VRTNLSEEALEDIASGKISERDDIKSRDIQLGLLGNTFGTGATVIYIGGRSDQVLRNMQDQNYITEEERLAALDELQSKQFKPARDSIRAAHFTLWVREQIEDIFQDTAEKGLIEQGGLTVQTTLDWKLQEIAERIIKRRSEDIATRYQAQNISLVALDPKTNEILAYVGNTDYADEEHGGKIDMVQVPRQPGSTFKPLVYAAAFTRGYGPATVLYDVRTKFGPNEPQNFDGGFWGLTTIRRALGGSRNIPAIKAYYLGGAEDKILDFVEKLGAPTPKQQKADGVVSDYGYTLAIGSAETPLMEMTQAYATFADYGKHRPAQVFKQITDRNKALIPIRNQDTDEEEVLDPRIAYQITSILSDVSARPGEYWQSALTVPGYQAAAKTGTSNACIEWRDASKGDCKVRKPNNLWTIGYTPDLVVGVWVGNANSAPLPDNADGLNVAAPIWKEFMIEAHKIMENPSKTFEVPDGLVQPQVSLLSGELPTDCTPVDQRRSDLFLRERAPSKNDPGCVQVEVDKVTRLLASDSCPAEAREMQSFLRPLNIEDSGVSSTILRQWQEGIDGWASAVRQRGSGSALAIAPTEKCDLSKTPGRLSKPKLEVLVPVDGGIATYPTLTPSIDFSVGSGVLSIQYEIDGTLIETVTRAPYDPALRIPRSIDAAGTHTLKVTLTDTYYNKVSKEVRFRFEEDLEAPEVNFLIPSDDISIQAGRVLRMQARATDEGGIKYVEIYWGSTLLTRLLRPPFTFEYSLAGVTPGEYTLKAVATDYGGNTDETSLQVTVE
jgi:membrane carboxypeptidase/penicillin-binding protein PbpC